MKLTSQHIPFAKLADLAEGSTSADERAGLEAHLNACANCAGRLESLGQLVNLMRTDTSEDAPRDVLMQAVGLFGTRSAARRPSIVRRALAALSFDSLQLSPLAHGVRSEQAASRQLLYTAGENDLDLRITPSDETWVVSGQVLGQCQGGEARLESNAGTAAAISVDLNEVCEFTLPPVPAGSYTLRLRLPEMEIEVPELELKA